MAGWTLFLGLDAAQRARLYGFIIIFSQLDSLLIAGPQFISAPVKRSRDRLP